MSVDQESPPQPEGIAIIGMSCRFPGAATVEQFWENLRNGVESIHVFSDEELELAAIDPVELKDPKYVKARGVLEGIEQFDSRFFEMSAREADITDPQQRVFLECAWEALERAGYNATAYPGPIGVYAGAGANGYLLHNLASAGYLVGTVNAFQGSVHNKNDHLATRVAYKLNLRGPAVTVQTACSTSLVAVVHACQSLLSHQCDMALAGGVTLSVPQKVGYLYNERGIGSPDGHCRAFDAQAQGTVGGSGAGVVVLKRLSEALADGDVIHAVIRGGALNNDGSDKVGYTAPSVEGQAEVISMAHALAGVHPDSISYVEAHGTGTAMGDPIEVKALTQAFRQQTQRTGYCAIGSVKTNVGHLDTAAGVAALIKTALSLEHRHLPASLHFESPNPEIDFAASPFYVNGKPQDWKSEGPRRAGVSSFGLGGTNAHVVVEEPPAREASGASRPFQVLMLSARSDAALEAATTRLAQHLEAHPTLPLGDVAFTLHGGRKAFEHRRIVVARDTKDAAAALAALSPERVFTRTQEPVHRPVFFMFTGQGSQHPGMAADLYRTEPLFQQELDRCLEHLRRKHDLDLRPLLMAARDDADAAKRLEQTALTQPALFAVEYALAKLLMAWGLQPNGMIGHSVGEYVAACLAGVFSLEDALDVVALRGRLMQSCPAGAMLSVPLPEHEVEKLVTPGLELAAANGPASCVVAGSADAVAALERQLAGREVVSRRLRTSHAFHSAMMEPILAPFREAVARVRRNAPKQRFISNVTGRWVTAEQAVDPDYWAQHLRRPVRFADGLDVLLEDPRALLLEVGPGQALRTLARWHPRKKPDQFMMATLPQAQERTPDVEHLLRTLGHLWLVGVETPGLFSGEKRHRVELPTYPFQRQRHWVELRATRGGARRGSLDKRADVGGWFYLPLWRESPPPKPEAAQVGSPWLVLADREGVGTALAARLRQRGETVIEVATGKAFRRVGGNGYELNPARREDYAALLSELAADMALPTRIVHLFGLTPGASGAPGAASSEDVVARSFHSLLFLGQALGGQRLEQPVHLVAVSNGMQEVTGEDLIWPEQATVLGPCQVIPREQGSVRCRSVDVMLAPAGTPQRERLVEQLVSELDAEAADAAVAWRGNRRWVRSYDEYRLEAGATPPLREGGVYLVTGGLGGMGLSLAEDLAARARGVKLVLTSRSELPPREQWTAWLEQHGPEDATARRLRALLRLEEKGAQVLVQRADVTDLEGMRRVVAEARERFGGLHGVIHAAGVAGGGLLQLKTREATESVLAPKVRGTQVLAAVLEGLPLDFLVACSSLSSVVGRLGQVDYTAANAFMDAFVRSWHTRTGTHAVAINWGAWDEVGMAARPSARGAAPEPEGKPFGHPLLQRCLEDSPQRMVFATRFDVSSQWVVDEHRIVGNPAVPGVTYFEMIRAALAPRARGQVIELQDIFFLAPLRVPEGEWRELRLILDAEADGWRWVARSQPTQGQGKATDHVIGRVRLVGPRVERKVDLEEVRRRCNRPEKVSFEVEHEEDLGPRWRSVRNAHLGQGELLLALEMPAEFHGDFDALKLHPALIDRASGMAKGSLGERGFYLPLGYKALRIHGDLPARIYSHARSRPAEGNDRETLGFDFTLLDEHGQVLVEAERLMQKRVNDPGAEIRALASAAQQAAAPAATDERQEILPAEGADALWRILSARMSPQVIVSVRDLQATLESTDETVRERILDAAGDVATTGERRARPQLKTPYVAPRNELEQKLAEAWQQVLGIDRVGVEDNFFDLGGDSVQAIQIIAKGGQLGLQLNPQQFFQYSTIAELAEALGGTMSQQADQGPVVGPVPLSPDQRRTLGHGGSAAARASRGVRLELPVALDIAGVRKALGELLTHHDALRLRFTRGLSGWQQAAQAPGEEAFVSELDLSGLAESDQAPALHGAEEKLRARLDPGAGPLAGATLVRRGPGRPPVLMLAGLELALDGTSWRLLVEDLTAALRRQAGGGEAQKPKTQSFKRWAERLVEEASSDTVRTEGATWFDGPWDAVAKLPASRGANAGPVRPHTVSLPVEDTQRLHERLAETWRAEVPEALLTGVLLGLASWTGRPVQLVDVVMDGREAFKGLDFARTVGHFEVSWPLLADTAGGTDVAEALKRVKERVRRVPRRGISHGLLLEGQHAELAERLQRLPKAEVAFRYLGAAADVVGGRVQVGAPSLSRPLGGHVLEVQAVVASGQLHLTLLHEPGALPEADVDRLARAMLETLRALGSSPQDTRAALSVVDFPLSGLDNSQLQALASMLEEDEDDAG